MRPTIYIETTVISYLTSRPSRDVVVAGHQQTTHEWWNGQLSQFEAFVSPAVLEEISKGDREMAQRRLRAVAELEVLRPTPAVPELADAYFAAVQMPERARADAYHLAFAAQHGMDFMVSWNCTHIASGFVRRAVKKINDARGIATPTICTPEELMEAPDA